MIADAVVLGIPGVGDGELVAVPADVSEGNEGTAVVVALAVESDGVLSPVLVTTIEVGATAAVSVTYPVGCGLGAICPLLESINDVGDANIAFESITVLAGPLAASAPQAVMIAIEVASTVTQSIVRIRTR